VVEERPVSVCAQRERERERYFRVYIAFRLCGGEVKAGQVRGCKPGISTRDQETTQPFYHLGLINQSITTFYLTLPPVSHHKSFVSPSFLSVSITLAPCDSGLPPQLWRRGRNTVAEQNHVPFEKKEGISTNRRVCDPVLPCATTTSHPLMIVCKEKWQRE